MQKKYKVWDWFPAQSIQEWEDIHRRMLTDAILIPASERKNHKSLFTTIKEIEKFLRLKGKKFMYL